MNRCKVLFLLLAVAATACSGPLGGSRVTALPDAIERAKQPKQLVYVSSAGASTVTVFDVSGSKPSVVRTITNGINNPISLAVDKTGDLFVTNPAAQNVTEYRPGATKPCRTFTKGLVSPFGIVVGTDGTVYVSNWTMYLNAPGSVVIYPPAKTTPRLVVASKNFSQVQAVTLDKKNNLYIAFTNRAGGNWTSQVDEFPAGSTSSSSLKLLWTIPGMQSQGIAFDNKGNAVVSVSNTGTGAAALEIFKPGSKRPFKTIGESTLVNYPQQVAFDADDSVLYVGSAQTAANAYDYSTWALLNTLDTSSGPATGVAVQPAAAF